MSDIVAPSKPRRRYQPKREVAMAAYPGLTPGSAHSKELRTVAAFLALIQAAARKGDRAKIIRIRTQMMVAESQIDGASLCLMSELQDVHRANLAGDAARFTFALDQETPGNVDSLLRTTYREIAELKELAVALEARKAAA